ncbi:sugar ABC transporter permease [Paenibacillus flagellatus]|uniref:Sugar ABC transporter permease n=2 Tax=Paenibacillus flagellatus TaxID=2211139 RepID=A0A2V5K721_9BACL|nr:sugar ABC transporter permease [Paenibacillus flagellatus]
MLPISTGVNVLTTKVQYAGQNEANGKQGFLTRLSTHVKRDLFLLLLISPVLVYYIVFHYFPMYGVIIAFKDYSPVKGIWGSPWVGLKWFEQFFDSIYAVRVIKNTVLLSVYGLLWGFPVPILFALLLNELKNGLFKRIVQTTSYLPHFISVVVIGGMIISFLSPAEGVVNMLLAKLGFSPINFLSMPGWFRTIYIGSDVWQSFGWNSIIYLAAITSIDPSLYEAAKMDGAKRWQQIRYITLPGIRPTIIILLIMNMGHIMNVGFEKIILLYNPSTYAVSDVISTFVYRRGLEGAEYGFASAVGLFNSAVNFALLVTVNRLSRKTSGIALW